MNKITTMELTVPIIANDPALPRVTYANSHADFSGVHDLFDRQLPIFMRTRLKGECPNLIGGRRREGAAYAVSSPIDRAVMLGTLFKPDDDQIDAAVGAAAKAFPEWRETPLADRIAALRHVAGHMRQHRFEIGARLILEVGKIRMEAMAEIEEAIDIVNYYCDEAERTNGWSVDLAVTDASDRAQSRLRPFGVFAVISPFNFPFALATGMISAALLAGNTVVWKPTELAALTAPALTDAFLSAGLPPGVFNMIAGGGDIGEKLVGHRDIAGVAFTGSYAAGMSIFRGLAQGAYTKPLLAELGGKNATFVTASADIDMAAKAVARAAFAMSGQKCSACSKVYVAQPVREAFTDRLISFTAGLRCGDPILRETYLGPVINAATGERFERAVAEAREQGRIVHGGRILDGTGFAGGVYLEPTIVCDRDGDHWTSRQELFAPFLSVLPFSDLDQAVADSNRGIHGLTAGIYTNSQADLDAFIGGMEAGVLYANRPSSSTTGAWPGFQVFSGWKGSGTTGKGALGPHYVQQFMREQSLTLRIFP